MEDEEEIKKRRALAISIHPNKTGFTREQGFCSCGQFQIANYGICRRCTRELEERERELFKPTQTPFKPENQERVDNISVYDEKLTEAVIVIQDLADKLAVYADKPKKPESVKANSVKPKQPESVKASSAKQSKPDKQLKRIENAKNRVGEL